MRSLQASSARWVPARNCSSCQRLMALSRSSNSSGVRWLASRDREHRVERSSVVSGGGAASVMSCYYGVISHHYGVILHHCLTSL